jgi:hypothetical protein
MQVTPVVDPHPVQDENVFVPEVAGAVKITLVPVL